MASEVDFVEVDVDGVHEDEEDSEVDSPEAIEEEEDSDVDELVAIEGEGDSEVNALVAIVEIEVVEVVISTQAGEVVDELVSVVVEVVVSF